MPDALPYRSASDNSVRAGAWTLVTDGDAHPMPVWLEVWDYAMPIEARREIEIDGELLTAETALAPDTQVAVGVNWRVDSSAVNGPIVGPRGLRLSDGTRLVDLELMLAGDQLGPAVEFETFVMLESVTRRPDGPIACRPGSVLWRDKKKLKLLGNESQFPLATVNFALHGLPPGTPWTLMVDNELEAPVMGQVQLLVNERFPAVVAAVRGEDQPSAAAIRSALQVDVGRMLVERALCDEELLSRSEWPDESLGQVLRTLVASRVRGPLKDLKSQMENDPVGWSARMNESFRLFADVER